MSDRILLKNADRLLEQLGSEFRRASWIIYTLGTSIVYELNESGEIVANCHKVPANRFTRRFLNLDEITEAFNTQYRLIKEINSETKFILTVSPVRHQKESFQQNNLSKSILRVAIEEILNSHEDVQYFPAFEIMMDELRDYRFYESDMLHPNEVAGDYIWQKFQEVYFDEQVRIFIEKWAKVRKAMAHRPFNRRSPQHQEFIRKTIQKVNEFRKEVDVHRELELLNAQLL